MSDPKALTMWSKVESVDVPAELGLNLRWSRNHSSDELWKRLDATLWEAVRNPWIVLQAVSKGKVRPVRAAMIVGKHSEGSQEMVAYSADVSATRPASDCTFRVSPYHPSASLPFELSQILWQR